jgi:LCP family protein required for cell wall assembly
MMSRRHDVDDDTGWGKPRGRRRGQRSGSRRSRRSLGQRIAAYTSIAVVAVLVGGTLVAYAKYRSIWDSIERIDVAGLVGNQPPKLNNAENILLIGSDTRLNQGGIGGNAASTPGSRSDTLMLLHISPGNHDVTVISIPRETMVPVISCPAVDGTTGQQAEPGDEELINAALDFGGPVCTWKTFESVTGIHIDHFIELDFTGFEKIINDLHGVEVCLPFAVDDPASGLNLSKGRHHIYGPQALAFWRTREDLGTGSDLERIERDQFLMVSLLHGIENSGLLHSPSKILNVVRDASDAMTTDQGLDQNTILEIGDTMRGISTSQVQFITAPNIPDPDNDNNVVFEQPEANELFNAIQHDDKMTASNGGSKSKKKKKSSKKSSSPTLDSVSPSKVNVQVLNGSGTQGIASQVGSDLTNEGFNVVGTGDANNFGYTRSVIEYAASSDLPAVDTLKSVVPNAEVLPPDPSLTPGTVELIVGSDFTSLNPVPSSSGSASPSPSVTSLGSADGAIKGNTSICQNQSAFVGPDS